MQRARAGSIKNCAVAECTMMAFKNSYCVDHYRTHCLQVSPVKAQVQEARIYMVADAKDKTIDQVGREFANQCPDITLDQLEKYKELFNKYDTDGDHVLNFFEVNQMMESLGQTMTHVEVRNMIKEIDLNNDGDIDFCEFLNCMFKKRAFGSNEPAGPASLFGRICNSALFDRAKFFEEKIFALKRRNSFEERQMAKRELAKKREEEERQKKEEEEKAKKEAEDRKAAFKARNEALFGKK
eukprot:GILI01003813.1.p1 GENE.GILI01003813.1~~GILI01003813.1.p1  ORF type:complete len:270 (-),score=97.04 GILI01003813.1:299-1018(-)